MVFLTIGTSIIATIALVQNFYQRKELKEVTDILCTVAYDVQEVRTVTHGKPQITFSE